jgi:hypothetical protein
MNHDVEDLLRSGMERFTEEVQAPCGLADRIARARSRRRLTGVAAGTGVAAVATAVAVIAGTGAASIAPPAPAQVRTAAYVIKRVENALAGKNAVVRTEYTFSPAFPAITQWNYRGNFRSVQSGFMWLKGSPWAQGQESWGIGTATIDGKQTSVQVDFRHHEWYSTPGFGSAPNGCSSGQVWAESGGPTDWATYIRQALSCGEFTIAGHARINGKETIKITGSMKGTWLGHRTLLADATLFVDPSTYLPVQVIWSNRSSSADDKPLAGLVREDIRLLPPTPGNVAKASVTVPAGFRKVPSGTFGGPVFQFFH